MQGVRVTSGIELQKNRPLNLSWHGLLFVVLFMVLLSVADAQNALRSPWDGRPAVVKNGEYECPPMPAMPRDINAYSFYSDDKHSEIDPKLYAAYNEEQTQFRSVTAAIEDAADTFQRTGSRGAAACVVQILARQADANAMLGKMASNQSYYVQNWTIGALAVAWLKVRQSDIASPTQQTKMLDWMANVAHSTMTYFDERHAKKTKDGQNNHYYWAGFAVMTVGIATNDRKLFDWGVSTYNDAMQRVQPDGTLPLEMDRGQRALHYHLFALEPLVTMAEFGAANNIDLYGADNGALHLLVRRSMSGLIDNSYFASKVGVPQDTPEKGKIKPDDVLWLTPYLRRFPNADIAKLLHAVREKPIGYLGGLPPP